MASTAFSYLAVLDYEHLDNGLFLTNFAQALSQQNNMRRVILHGDSAYTERIMQTGVMREEARVRSIKDLNRRLVALLADEGVAATGIDGYQRKFIVRKQDQLHIDAQYFKSLPPQPAMLISNLLWDADHDTKTAAPLGPLALALQQQLELDSIFVFRPQHTSETGGKDKGLKWDDLDDNRRAQLLPHEFKEAQYPLYLATPQSLRSLPDLSKCTQIT